MTRRRWGFAAFAAALCCLVLGVLLPPSADAAAGGRVQVSLPGQGFTAHPGGSLFQIGGVAPGTSTSALLGVRSGFGGDTTLGLKLLDVHDDDNGCTPSEALVDRSCGVGDGDLGSSVVFTVATSASRSGTFAPAWTGTVAQLQRGAATQVMLQAHEQRWLRVTAALPAAVGNEIQSDTFGFRLRVELAATSGIAGVSVGTGSSHGASGHGVDSLALTGASVSLLTVGGALLLLAGVLIWRSGTRRGA
jgi:hypothetical protein